VMLISNSGHLDWPHCLGWTDERARAAARDFGGNVRRHGRLASMCRNIAVRWARRTRRVLTAPPRKRGVGGLDLVSVELRLWNATGHDGGEFSRTFVPP